MAFLFSPGECRITLAMREKEWGLSFEKKHMRIPLLSPNFLPVLADTSQQTWHNPTRSAGGNILTTIMKPTVLCWKWVLSWLLAQTVCHNIQHSLWNPQITPLPCLIHPHLFLHMDCCSQVCQLILGIRPCSTYCLVSRAFWHLQS